MFGHIKNEKRIIMIDCIADFISKDEEIKELQRQLANMKSHREREIKAAVDSCREAWKNKLKLSAKRNAQLNNSVESARASRDLAKSKYSNLMRSHELLINNKDRITKVVAKMKLDGLLVAQNKTLANRCFVDICHFNNTMAKLRATQ